MKKLTTILLFVQISLANCSFDYLFSTIRDRVSPHVQKKAAQDVISRLLGPDNSALFDFKINETYVNGNDGFQVFKSDQDNKVLVSGPNGLSLVWGVHYYLKNYCNCHISWDGDQLNLPKELPSVNVTIKSVDKIRFYQNACTSSYSFAWWDWRRWEREIDWMALNGVNLALAFTGQEAIWQRVYDALGLKSNDFTGPAFLAWNRMGNLRKFGGGLTRHWMEEQVSLQHKILKRMRDLGIIPVSPGFCGIVPQSFIESYPLSNVTKMSKWSRFNEEYCCPLLLSPSDDLFSIISRVFMREYISEFDTNHIYSCDTFNENIPTSGDTEYLNGVSSAIYTEMRNVDPNAVWMVQGWMFLDPFWESKKRVKAFLRGPPVGKMLILDLQSDLTPQYKRLSSYYGQPFIWCTLLNFGGQLGMYGHLGRINHGVLMGRTFVNSTMVGVGITPEGIDQNYLMYEFTLESALRSDLVNLTDWVRHYALRRYGALDENARNAWFILKETAYNYRPETLLRETLNGPETATLLHGEHISKNIMTRLPSLKMGEPIWYNRSEMLKVFKEFLLASENEKINSSELFHHDLIDVTRQTIQFAVSGLYFKMIKEYALLDVDAFQNTSTTFLNLLDELDMILGTGKKFLLGRWLADAKRWGRNENETTQYEFNARNQITLWGPDGEIRDYAAKQWSGLVADYYKPRWAVFIDALNHSLLENVPCNSSAIKEKMFLTVEKPFGKEIKFYPTQPIGNPVEVIREFANIWNNTLREIFNSFASSKFEVKSL